MLEVGDRTHYKMMKGRTLKSVHRFSKYQWDCILRGGKLLQIRFKTGILGMTIGDSEYELGDEIMLVGMDNDWKKSELSDSPFDDMEKEQIVEALLNKSITNKVRKKKPKLRTVIPFSEVMEFMDWKCKEENIWDVYID